MALAILVASAQSLRAQEAPPATQIIVIQEKNPAAAGLFSLLIPGGGQLYNGQTGRGIAHIAVGVVTLALATSATETCSYPTGHPELEVCEVENPENAGAWAAVFLGNTVWSIVTAVSSAKRLNADQRARIQPTATPDGRVGLSVSLTTR